jgi:seryl-tRNA synthetase
MLELNSIRTDREKVVEGLKKRGIEHANELLDDVIRLDDDRKNTQTKADQLLAESNQLSRQIGQMMKEGRKNEANEIKTRTAELKTISKNLIETLKNIELDLKEHLLQIPNVPQEDVPGGSSEEDNLEVFRSNWTVELNEDASPHWELAKRYNIIDFELGNKVTGAGFPFYKGMGAKIQRALVSFFLDEAEKAGYLEIQPPLVVNKNSGMATGQIPDKEGQMYEVIDEELFLIPTAEVPITNIYRDEIIDVKDLPKKNAAYSLCFRREAGSWGAHVRGLNRLHQFDKVEIVHIEKPSRSAEALEEMKKHVSGLLEKLELPYRILLLCAGDLGFTSAITFDFEVFSAAQKRWLEVSSVSNFHTYQSNRLKLRFKDETNKKQLLHTLNGSALAFPRVLAAILENNQTNEGIRVPKVLVPYVGFEWIRN